MEGAFFGFEVKVMGLCNLEDITNGCHVIFKISLGGNANIVHVHLDCCSKRFMFKDGVMVDVVHHCLECW